MNQIAPRVRGLKNAFMLLSKGNWSEFCLRMRIAMGHVDLRNDLTETISERTHYYADSGGIEFDKIIENFEIHPTDSIIDFGCGKGGTLISLSKYPFAKIKGVEISPDLADVARRNLKTLNITNVEVTCCDASQFTSLSDYNFFYFFDPFPWVVMKDVLNNIRNSVRNHPRKITIIYLNPFCHDLIHSETEFLKVRELPHFQHKCYVYTNESPAVVSSER